MRFSEFYNLDKTQPYLDFVDIPLHTDVEVFLDPTSIKALDTVWGHELSSLLQTYFQKVLQLIQDNEHEDAINLLSGLSEGNEFHLGFSKDKSQGKGFGPSSAKLIWEALFDSDAVKSGLLEDIEDTALMIKGIGPDMISDAVCNILRGPLIKYTQDMCQYYNVPLIDNVESGKIWNAEIGQWEETLTSLPIAEGYGKIILIPKNLVRHSIAYDGENYYRHYLLPVMQEEHIQNKSPLVQLTKKQEAYVTKKDLMAKYGSGKLAIVRETISRPYVLQQYKSDKLQNAPKALRHNELAKIEESEPLRIDDLKDYIKELRKLDVGKNDAYKYEDIIEKILTVIFYPSLTHPSKQTSIHSGRKRIDITYKNSAHNGFFSWVSKHYASSLIFIECKNYSSDITNPEIDQLAGRFSPNRGKVGLLIFRETKDKELLYQRCKDTAQDDKGFILALDDNDISILVDEYIDTKEEQEFKLLDKLFKKLIT